MITKDRKTTTQKAPDIYKSNYYTPEEYNQLMLLIEREKNRTLEYMILSNIIQEANSVNIKRKLKRIYLSWKAIVSNPETVKHSLWEAMYCTPLGEVPLLINDSRLSIISMWRLQINK